MQTRVRNPERIPLMLEVIRRAWEKAPDLRFGQLVLNTRIRGVDDHTSLKELYDREDDKMLEDLLLLYGS